MLHTSPCLGSIELYLFINGPPSYLKKNQSSYEQFSKSHLSQEESTSFYESQDYKVSVFLFSPSTSCCLELPTARPSERPETAVSDGGLGQEGRDDGMAKS